MTGLLVFLVIKVDRKEKRWKFEERDDTDEFPWS